MSRDDFLAAAFNRQQPELKVMWITASQKEQIAEILNHRYRGLRIRYWVIDQRFAWIIDEVGKEKPITIGVVVEDDRIRDVTVLDFRETRGGEVRYDFFTRQFLGAELNRDLRLNKDIDGITGATMSVRAVKDVTELALYLTDVVATANNTSMEHLVGSQD